MNSFSVVNKNGLEYLESNLLSSTKAVSHFFSSKKGGVSEGDYESLNLGVFTGDKQDCVRENFKRICTLAGMNEKVGYLNQYHGTDIIKITRKNFDSIIGTKGDALITNEKGLPIGVFTADCVPILLYDKSKGAVAAIHAGWRGVEGKILSKTLKKMEIEFQTNPADVLCAVGPFIGLCCFEVSKDVADKFSYKEEKNASIYVDLLKEVYSEALENGILKENIDLLKECTVCRSDEFFSYRRDNGKTGRIGSFIEIL